MMAKAKTASAKKSSSKKAKEPIVEIDGVSVHKSDLDKMPIGKTFSVASSQKVEELIAADKSQNAATSQLPDLPAVAEPAANVIWSSEPVYKQVTKDGEQETVAWVSSPTDVDKEGKLKHGNPPAVVKIGITPVPVPDADKQLTGFYSKDAARLVRAIPGYKFLKPKG
jgi:hypothetical protein